LSPEYTPIRKLLKQASSGLLFDVAAIEQLARGAGDPARCLVEPKYQRANVLKVPTAQKAIVRIDIDSRIPI
jgi:hypothetical protein